MADDRISKNLHLVYSALKSEGYTDIGDEQDFIKKMQDEQNRLKVYNALKGAGYSDMGSDFKSFSGMIYTAPQPKPQEAAPAASPQSSSTTIKTNVVQPAVKTPVTQQPSSAAPKNGDGSMLMAPKQEQPSYKFNFTANTYHGVPMLQNDEKGNPKVSGGTFNPVTGHYEGEGSFYTDWMGNKIPVNSDYGKAAVAYQQHVQDVSPINAELDEAYKERDRINKMLSDRMGEIDKTEDNQPWYIKMLREGGRAYAGDKMGGAGSATDHQLKYNSDQQYRNIMSAARKNRAAIKALEDKKNGKQDEFWHAFGNAIANGYTFSQGDSDWGDVNALIDAQKHMPEIERKQKTGEKLTKDEEIAATVIKNHAWDNDVQQRYGDEYGAWARAGETAVGSLELGIDFLTMGPELKATAGSVMKLTEKGATKLLGEAATKGLGKYMTKTTGATVGSMIAGAEMANAIGINRTMSDVGKRYLGNVTVNEEDGSYQFDGGQGFMQSLYEAEMSAAIENGSEVLGEFLPGSGIILKGLEKVGMKKVASGLTRLGGSTWYKNYTKALKAIGFHGVGGEAVEEYAGLLGNALLVGDNRLSDLLDPRTHVDIWLGCAVTGGLLNAPRPVVYGAYKGYQAAQYYRYKHKTDKADAAANAVWGDEWSGLRDRIDGTSNEDMTDLATSIYTDADMTPEQKRTALDYIGNLTAMRGYNMGRISMEREDENGRGTSDDERSLNNAFAAGYNATAQEDMEDAKNAYDMHRQLVENNFDEWTLSALDGNETDFNGEPYNPLQILGNMAYDPVIGNAFTDEQRKIAADYLNAKARYDGMLQRVRDDIDSRISASDAAIDQRTNRMGYIRPATMKLDDRRVYVMDGDLVMYDDGSMIDVANSSESILVRDADTGKLEWASPHDFLSVDEEIDPAAEKEAAQATIREQYAEEQAQKIDGTLPFNDGDIYSVMEEDGTQWTAQILADNGDGTVQVAWNGNVNNPQTVSKDFVQELSTNAAMARLAQNEQERAMQEELDKEDEFQQERPTYNLNDEVTLRGENGEPVRGSITTEENEDGQIEVYTETPINGKKIHMFTRQQIDDMLMEHNGETVVVPEAPAITAEIDNAGAVQSEPSTVQNDVDNVPQTTENVQNGAENVPAAEETVAVEPMPMVGEGEDAEPDFSATTPQRAHDYIFNESGLEEADATAFTKNNVEAANKELEKIKSKKPKMGTSIAKFNKDKAEWERKVNEAQTKADYWKQVKEARDKVLAERMAEQQERERQQIEQAQADEAAYREEMARKEAEQAALGTNNVSPAIREKWTSAPKIEGAQDEIVLPNGEKVEGRYYLVESGAASASHDSNNGFAKTEGFPIDENGGSVNDRDYERDMDAQRVTRDIANNYDSRAVQTPVVVSQDGVVLSGNGRTMAGELAAAQNTDAAYNSHIAQYPTKWGFTKQQVEGMQHPRVVFVPDAAMPYTAETFAKFNQQEMKSQNKTEQAVKLGKVVSDKTFNRIIDIINRFDTLGDFYADDKATSDAIRELQSDGVLSQAQMAEMYDGGGISAIGKEILENTLIGKAFESNPNAVREITEFKSMRQSIITALAEISNNLSLGKDYSLESELAQAIDLVYQARKSGSKFGELVSWFARQLNLDFFGLNDTVADYNNATMLMIADIINDNRSSRLKKYIQIYNHNAQDSANGQIDLFTGSVKSKEDIINEVKQLFNNGSEEEQQKAAQEAVARRKAESVQENGTVANGSEAEPAGEVKTEGEPSRTMAEEVPAMTREKMLPYMQQFFMESNGDMRLLDNMTDEELQKFLGLLDAWEEVNDTLGAAHTANDKYLNDKNKAIAKKAKEAIDSAEQLSSDAFVPVQDYYNELCDKYGITDEEEPAANATDKAASKYDLATAIAAAEAAKEQIIETRNNNRNEAEQQTETNTQAVADEAAAVAGETESVVSSGNAAAISEQVSKIDEQLEKVNKQLALLGYYEADTEDPSKFHESYGYMKTAEKKALADALTLSRRLCKALGMTAIPKREVQANISPIGGDITFRIPLSEGKSLYFNIGLDNDHDNLSLSRIMYRVEEKQDGAKYWNSVGHSNNYLPNDVTVDDAINDIKRTLRYDAPEFEIKEAPASTSAKQSKTTENNPKSKKKAVSLQQEQQLDLFGDLFSNLNEQASETSNSNNNETTDIQSRTEEEGRGGQQPQQDAQVGRSAGHEAEGSDGQGMGGRSSSNTLSDGERSLGLSGIHQSQQHVEPATDATGTVATENEVKTSGTVAKNTNNNHAERGKDYAPKGVDARIEANIKAIELMQQLMLEGKQATPAQMKVLRQYSGWGGLGKAFNENPNGPYSYNPTTKRLKELLGDEAFRLAEDSKDSAFYTPAMVIDTMWDIARAMGFKGGTVLEGSAGIGNIIGAMPADMSKRSDIHAVEIDETTGNILSLLYPDAKVDIQGFEQTKIANGSVDLAITNVPFVTGLNVRDESGDLDLSKKFKDIHDFCIAKNVRKLREGGIGIFITSSGTLDNSQKLRNWLVGEGGADVVGAFRLHNKTFGGAKVTSDIIVVRKRVNGQKSAHAIDVSTVTAERTGTFVDEKQRGKERTVSMDYNKYFMEHPECMAGEMFFGYEKGDNYRPSSKSLYPVNGKDQETMLAEWLKGFDGMKEETQRVRTANNGAEKQQDTVYESLGDDVKEGSLILDKDGKLCVAQYGKAVPLSVNANKVKGHTKAECFQSYQAIKSALADVLAYQTENEGDEGLKPLLDKLNKAYDGFVKTYGHLHKNTSISFLKNDVDFPNILALEKHSEEGDKKGNKVDKFEKTDIFKQRVVEKDKAPEPKNVKDGIIASIYQYGRIDVPYIAEKVGKSVDDVKQEIVSSGLGFENPNTLQMEVSYEYLSGNVREKLKQAEEANEGGKYAANIEALRKVIPLDIPAHLIDFTLGSSWVEPKLYEDYIKERTDVDAQLTNVGGTWYMNVPYYVQHEKNKAMGVRGEVVNKLILGSELIEAALQNKTITVSETHSVGYGSSKTTETITDKEATQACAAKIDEIRADFKEWAHQKMQSDAEMSARIEKAYNEQFNNYVPIDVSMDFVPEYFGGANHKFKMREHQAKAIVRGTMQPLLLAHEVGTGKTFTLISTAMEMRRLGTAKKPMIVVQNATVGQFVASAKELYPNAKVLTLEDKDRNEEVRKNFYAKIKYNDWDMIVVPQSVFERIPDSEERQMRFIQDKIDEKIAILEQMREADASGRSSIVRQAEKEIEQLKDQLGAIGATATAKRKQRDSKREHITRQNTEVKAREMLDRETDDVENFDDMGIDALLLDEAHEYKHLGFATAMQRGVKGIDPSYSKKSQGVYLKTQAVLEKNNGRNVIFATGTPISNTAAEIWTFMRYLMPADTMKDYGIYYFDDFVRNFGNLTQMLEFTTNGKFKENNRFAGYVNLPELVRIWSSVADTVRTDEAQAVKDNVPDIEGGKAQDIYLPQTRALRSIMKFVKAELERFEKMSGKEKKENSHIPLTMYGVAKAAAVDARLVMADAEDDTNSKTNEAVRQTLKSLKETAKYKGTVALFADNYQNKHSGFNLYDDIRDKLIAQGVPADEVVVIRSGMTIKKKQEIFDKVNRGEIRVILGSTFTLGTGVNIQERLHTLIHLDVPKRPMDYTQRNGRIVRQGNLHKVMGIPVRVLRFGVQDSLDVTAYQRLKTKGAIADSIMRGKAMMQNSMEDRVMEEDEDVFGDTVAQLSGSQYAMLKNQAEREVRKYESKRKQWEADQTYVHNAIPRISSQIAESERKAAENNANLAKLEEAFGGDDKPAIKVGKHTFADIAGMADFFTEQNKKVKETEDEIRKSAGEEQRTRTVDVQIGNATFTIKTTQKKEFTYHGGTVDTKVSRSITISCPELGIENMKGGAYFKNAMENIFNDIVSGSLFREDAAYYTTRTERLKGELELVKSREGQPFQYDKELEDARQKLDEYTDLMKKEMEEKEKKYAEMDSDVEVATGITVNNDEEEEDDNLYRIVEDKSTVERLEAEPKMKAYRAMQVIDGRLYSPMAAKVDGKLSSDNPFDTWTEAEETTFDFTPEQVAAMEELDNSDKPGEVEIIKGKLRYRKDSKAGRGTLQFHLVKGDGTDLWAAYNPYIHSSLMMLNDQFTSAYKRPNIVVVEVEIPESELTSGYRAKLAKDAVGMAEWKAGPVAGQLPSDMGRKVMLSRWSKVKRIVPYSEVADHVAAVLSTAEQKKSKKLRLPIDSFHPELRKELEKRGFEFEYGLYTKEKTDKKGNLIKAWDDKTEEERQQAYKGAAYIDDAAIQQLNDEFEGKWMRREGDGTYSDEEISLENDPISKMLGKSRYTTRQRKEFALRERNRMSERVKELSGKLNLKNVDIVTDASILSGDRRRAKGFYNKRTGRITIVVPNHSSMSDIEQTLLHEAVAHYGLRELFGEQLDSFLDNVYQHAEPEIRSRITEMARLHGWDFRKATEEYLAGLAETTDFEGMLKGKGFYGWWSFVKRAFLDMLHKIGFSNYDGPQLSDNELRYILWRSYENLKEPGRYRSILGEAEDISKQMDLKVGNFAEETGNSAASVADGDSYMYRDGDVMDKRDHAIVRDRYDRMTQSGMYQFREAMQDSMLSLRRLMEYISQATGEKVKDFENAYMAENALSSKNHAEQDLYGKLLFNPMLDEIHRLAKEDSSRDEVTRYMMAKHGLERNEVMAARAAKKAFESEDNKDASGNPIKSEADFLAEYRERDFGGITGLMEEDDLVIAEELAQQLVSDFENNHDVDELWARTNACTKATLEKTYKAGLLSKSGYDEISGMYEYYIPLRGFDATTSDEVYSYLNHERSGFSTPLKKAEGRKSVADDPIATIANMADSAIVQGNRNMMKQKFLKFAMNHPSDAVSVNRMWLRYDDVNDVWEAVTAKIDENDTPDEVLQKTEQFEETMRQLAEADPDHYKRGKDAANIPYKTLGNSLNEHQVHVKLGGDDYILTINGSPRAAQALNGLTNPDNDTAGAVGAILKAGEYVNRQMSAFYTTRNPEFVLSNFLRDAIYANSTMWVRERPNYAIKFNKNFLKVNPKVLYGLIKKHNAGKLDMNVEIERAFYQFMMNGGETGYTVVKDIDKQKKLIKKYVRMKDATIPVEAAWQFLGDKLDDINRSVENCARFAAFLTSRQMGRTVERSVFDAKEVSVNFNKKGAGSTFMGKTDQTKLGNLGAFISGLGRSFYVFWNAAVQGTTNFASLHKHHTGKALALDAGLFLLGAIISGLGGGDDDDYWNLPSYVRRSNICFKIPFTDSFVSIPLGIEQRAIYGLGELFSSLASGRERMSGKEIAKEIAGSLSSMLPLDLMESNGDISWSTVSPSYVKPFVETANNKDWKGMPIYKDTPYNKEDPEWTKASKRTNQYLVDFSKWCNELTGGDEVKKGWLNFNPSKIEHMFEGVFGGVSTTANKLVKAGEMVAGKQDFDWSNILIASRVVKSADENAEARRINAEYWKYYGEYKETKRLVDHYEDQESEGIMGTAEKLNFMYNSPEYGRYEIVDDYYSEVKDLSDELNETTNEEERKELETDINELKREMVEAIRAYDDARK